MNETRRIGSVWSLWSCVAFKEHIQYVENYLSYRSLYISSNITDTLQSNTVFKRLPIHPHGSLQTADTIWDKSQRWNTEDADLSWISEYTPEMVDKRINYHMKRNSLLKWRPSQIVIKGWLKTIKDINCNFHAISESAGRALAASYFQTLLFRVKTVCHLIQKQEGEKKEERMREK